MPALAVKQLIVPLGKRAGYMEARTLTASFGQSLPSHVLHDDYLVKTDLWSGVQSLYPAWAREIVVHPEKDGKFKTGKDVVDTAADAQGRPWVFPARYLPREAIGKQKVGLFVDPSDVRVEKYRRRNAVIVHPASIIVLHGFLQQDGAVGKADEATRIPLEVAPDVLASLPKSEKRWLYRADNSNVSPVWRVHFDFSLRRDIYLYVTVGRPSFHRGVAVALDLDVLQKANEMLAALPREQREAVARTVEQLQAH